MRMYKPPHVGELITETLNEINLSIDILAEKLGMNVFETKQLVNGNRIITLQIAKRLSMTLGSSPSFWLNIQKNYYQQSTISNAFLKNVIF
ncbi:HigA family addiction module antidote protein [Proteus mirabilis]|uniref:HigA family addiction module antitoxin n=1 Tax=Proteus mirabilis TaxID=584 RepID=UPI001BAEED95|nr:HigA family addiction module antitoxin [Proteus mirabilis]MBS3857567.1 HigA family addiction module antidote protein [Proteus mirabilis]